MSYTTSAAQPCHPSLTRLTLPSQRTIQAAHQQAKEQDGEALQVYIHVMLFNYQFRVSSFILSMLTLISPLCP